MANIVEKIAGKYGLKLNRNKCKIMIFNSKQKIKEIAEIEVVKNIKYLGIKIDNERKWYKSQKLKSNETALKMTNIMYSILGNCCNRMLIGKTFWKGLALPTFMYGQEIIIYNVSDLERMQRKENNAYRMILQLPRYTANAFLRGEVGASSFKARDMKNKIMYVKHALKEDGNGIVRKIIREEIDRLDSEWIKKVDEYRKELELSWEAIQRESKEQIKERIQDWDTIQWRKEISSKTTLQIYRNAKNIISEENWFRNGQKYNVMMKARSDTLKLAWREWVMESEKICKMCGLEVETLKHFLIECNELQSIRNNYIELQWPKIESAEENIKKMLLLSEDNERREEYYIDLLWEMWMERRRKCEEINVE